MDLVHLGDVPEWVMAMGAAVATWQAIGRHQQSQLLDFIELVQRQADIDGNELASAIDGSPVLAEVFARLWRTAAVSARDTKRQLLARIAAAALEGRSDDALLDELLVLADTTEGLQPYHVGLLAHMAAPRQGSGQLAGQWITGTWSMDELQRSYPQAGDMLLPLLRNLDSMALVENTGSGTYDNQPSWSVGGHGKRLLAYLPEAAA